MRIHPFATPLLALAAMFGAGAAQAATCSSFKVLYAATDGVETADGGAWGSATTLDGALAAANDNTNVRQCYEIRVKQGVYKPVVPVNPAAVTTAERSISFAIGRPLQLKGGYTGNTNLPDERELNARNTVLSGDIDNNDLGVSNNGGITAQASDMQGSNSYHVLTIGGTGGTTSTGGPYTADASDARYTLVEGFSITGGRANGSLPHDSGGGLSCNGRGAGSVCSPSINHVIFSGNAANRGGAIYNRGYQGNSSPDISHATFSGNLANNTGGAMYNDGASGASHPDIVNSTFSGNSAVKGGGALFNDALGGSSSPTIDNSTFSGNSTAKGGAIYNAGFEGYSSPQIINSTFSGNSASEYGGAIYNDGLKGSSSPMIGNATFSGNAARKSGGAIYNDNNNGKSSPFIVNSILWGNIANTAPQIRDELSDTSAQVGSSIVQGGWNGVGSRNLSEDPRLGPLQDNGGPTHTMLPAAGGAATDAGNCIMNNEDQRGVHRPQGSQCDIGAVELIQATLYASVRDSGTGTVSGGLGACASTSTSCRAAYVEGLLTATLTATPATGYTFTGWGGACTNTTGVCVITMDATRSVTATFARSSYSITASASPAAGGSVACTPNPVTHGASSHCTANPAPGYRTQSISGCNGTAWSENSFHINAVTAACTVTAQFEPGPHAITTSASPAAGGSVACTQNPVDHGRSTSCIASPATGYRTQSISGCSGTATSVGVNSFTTGSVTAACTVTASFELRTYAITATANPAAGGSVACADSSVAHDGGTTCTASPHADFTLSGFTGCDNANGNTCTLSNVTAARSVVANYAAVTGFSGTTVPSAGGTAGPASASFTGGGATCRFDTSTAFVAAPATLPAGQTLPHGMLQFKLVGCDETPVTMSVTWPAAVQGLSKWGKATPGAAPSHFAPNGLNVIGNVTTFTVQDGQLGDDDWTPNGVIVDPVGATVPVAVNATPVPTLSQWALVLLSLMAAALGAGTLRRRANNHS